MAINNPSKRTSTAKAVGALVAGATLAQTRPPRIAATAPSTKLTPIHSPETSKTSGRKARSAPMPTKASEKLTNTNANMVT